MEQLDLVYNAFSNLERNYSRSKKKRSEYIADKFGGDIKIGSFLILNVLSAEEFTDPEDIRKFSEIRNIFEFLIKNADRLDSLGSFDKDDAGQDLLKRALDAAQWCGTHIETCDQRSLYNTTKGSLHFVSDKAGSHVVPLLSARYCKVYNEAMAAFVSNLCKTPVEIGDIAERNKLGMGFSVVSGIDYR